MIKLQDIVNALDVAGEDVTACFDRQQEAVVFTDGRFAEVDDIDAGDEWDREQMELDRLIKEDAAAAPGTRRCGPAAVRPPARPVRDRRMEHDGRLRRRP